MVSVSVSGFVPVPVSVSVSVSAGGAGARTRVENCVREPHDALILLQQQSRLLFLLRLDGCDGDCLIFGSERLIVLCAVLQQASKNKVLIPTTTFIRDMGTLLQIRQFAQHRSATCG